MQWHTCTCTLYSIIQSWKRWPSKKIHSTKRKLGLTVHSTMISAEHLSNNGKINLPEKPHSMVIFWIKIRWSYWDLSSQADPARENWTWSYPYFNENERFTLVRIATSI